jgi:ankyrin repeat protein
MSIAKEIIRHSPEAVSAVVEGCEFPTVPQVAVAYGGRTTIDLVAQSGADLDITASAHGTPLHVAARRGSEFHVQNLRPHIGIYTRDQEGRLGVHRIAALRDRSFRFHSMHRKCSQRGNGNLAVTAANKQGRHKLHFLVAAGDSGFPTDLLEFPGTPHHLIAVSSDLFDHINNPDADGWAPLHWACRQPSFEVSRLLLSWGAVAGDPGTLQSTMAVAWSAVTGKLSFF